MGIFKKKKKKKTKQGVFESVEVNGQKVTVTAFYLYHDKKSGKSYIEIAAPEIVEALHYSEVDIKVKLPDRTIAVTSTYDSAYQKKSRNAEYKVYKFLITKYNEYYG